MLPQVGVVGLVGDSKMRFLGVKPLQGPSLGLQGVHDGVEGWGRQLPPALLAALHPDSVIDGPVAGEVSRPQAQNLPTPQASQKEALWGAAKCG